MVEKKDGSNLDAAELLQENYIPSESERKKVVVYYFLVWVLLSLNKSEITKYELFHLRQAIWWWTVFFLVFIFSMMWIFIPFLGFIPILLFIAMFWIWVVFVKQAWEWKYVVELNGDQKILFPFFVGIWRWILDLFETKFEIKDK